MFEADKPTFSLPAPTHQEPIVVPKNLMDGLQRHCMTAEKKRLNYWLKILGLRGKVIATWPNDHGGNKL